jgi:hypothetical protein
MRGAVNWAGLAAGPAAWAASTQANYALSSFPVASHTALIPVIAAVLAAMAAAGAVSSWIAWREPIPQLVSELNGVPHDFVAGLGASAGALFAIVVAMQGIAGLVLGA